MIILDTSIWIEFLKGNPNYFMAARYLLENQEVSDEDRTYESTVVSIMESQVNRFLLQIPMPDEMDGTQINADELLEKLKVEEIEILYKESDGLSVSVVDRITSEQLNAAGAVSIYE